MYERLLFLFKEERLNVEQLEVAVSKGWITEEQKQEIITNNSTQ